MKDTILEKLLIFLKENLEEGKPILLGYSGGFDSKALYYLLIKAEKRVNLKLHIAHIDHSWREKSLEQAKELKREVEKNGHFFHLKVLKNNFLKNSSNIEKKYRDLRFLFFKELFKKYGFQALFLAHQKNDLCETVLKRFLEGADFNGLKSMSMASQMGSVKIFRPLLCFSKDELKNWLKKNNLTAIDDETNRDTKYLRARMREDILPFLSEKFGKEILENLYTASLRANHLERYLDKKTEKYFQKRVDGKCGIFLDFSKFLDIEEIEKRYIIKKIAKKLNIDISRSILDRISLAIKLFKANYRINLKNCNIVMDRGVVFFQKKIFFREDKAMKLETGIKKWGSWVFDVRVVNEVNFDKKVSWEDLWKGEGVFFLPKGDYFLTLPKKGDSFLGKKLVRWFYDNRVPSFFRFCFPVIKKKGFIVHEFLSGKSEKRELAKDYYKVLLKLSD
jgi:tRNA(Ile)-lysidine synthase